MLLTAVMRAHHTNEPTTAPQLCDASTVTLCAPVRFTTVTEAQYTPPTPTPTRLNCPVEGVTQLRKSTGNELSTV